MDIYPIFQQGLIHQGARTLLVPGNVPMGCIPVLLQIFDDSHDYSSYDNTTGCDKRFNMLARYHNSLLLQAVKELRVEYPHARIIYADLYKPLFNFVKRPKRYGKQLHKLINKKIIIREYSYVRNVYPAYS